jgi:hypothetical protein
MKPKAKFSVGELVKFGFRQVKIIDIAYAYHLDAYSYSVIDRDDNVDFVFEKDLTK